MTLISADTEFSTTRLAFVLGRFEAGLPPFLADAEADYDFH
jgi:hypothetical protein